MDEEEVAKVNEGFFDFFANMYEYLQNTLDTDGDDGLLNKYEMACYIAKCLSNTVPNFNDESQLLLAKSKNGAIYKGLTKILLFRDESFASILKVLGSFAAVDNDMCTALIKTPDFLNTVRLYLTNGRSETKQDVLFLSSNLILSSQENCKIIMESSLMNHICLAMRDQVRDVKF